VDEVWTPVANHPGQPSERGGVCSRCYPAPEVDTHVGDRVLQTPREGGRAHDHLVALGRKSLDQVANVSSDTAVGRLMAEEDPHCPN